MFVINKKNYTLITDYFKNNKTAKAILKILYKLLPSVIFISYPLMLIYLFIWQRKDFLISTFVPAVVFILVTILRKLINRQRPYEKYNIPSVFEKDTLGQSMPSRHTASAFIISLAILNLNIYLGIIFLVFSFLIALSRLLAGVHFISDVLAGAVISLLFSIIFLL